MRFLSIYISKRISLTKDKKKISPAVVVAIIGVALSILIMILSLSIVVGFQNEIKNKIIGFNSHITIYPLAHNNDYESNIIDINNRISDILKSKEYVVCYQPIISTPAIIKTNDEFKGIYFKGVDGNYDFSFIENDIVLGSIPEFSDTINDDKVVISEIIAEQLSLTVGNKINIYFISDNVKVRSLKVEGIYNTHFNDYDNLYVYGSSSLVGELNNMEKHHYTTIEVTTDNFKNVEQYANDLHISFSEDVLTGKSQHLYKISTAQKIGESYWSWLALLDTNVIIIIVLMVLVSSFTLISAMLILILEKIRFIGIMKSIGASTTLIRNIFINLSIKIALIGIIIGNVIAISFIYFQEKFHFIKLDPQSYYIDYVPVDTNLLNFIVVNIFAIIIMWVLLILPSYVAGKISPIKTIRFE